MSKAYTVAQLSLLDNGNLEGFWKFGEKAPEQSELRFSIIQKLWDNHEFQNMLDRAIAADIAGTE